MSETDYSRASVLLFDPIHANQRTTRYTLFEIGFRQIECVATIKEFKEALSETSPNFVVAESSATDANVFKIIRAVRRSDLGDNPFVVFLLTTWSRDTSHIRKAIECGADDVIVRPFSTAFAEERIKTLVANRKEFIVTSDYIGPDRRKDTARDSDAAPFAVPNFLKATVEGDLESLAKAANWIKEANGTIITERMRRLAMRIVVTIELQLSQNTEAGKSIKLDFEDLTRTARELKAQLLKAKRPEAAEVAEALNEQIKTLHGEGGVTDSGLRLTKELAMGAFAAYANGESIERSKDEIGRTVSGLRKRIQHRSDMASQKATEEEAADDAGQDGSAGIKRAAM
jgi:DNA-binding response OmpR family regulator